MSLYSAETRRLSKRRMTRVFLVLLVLALAAVVGGTGFVSKQHTPAVLAQAKADAAAAYQQDTGYANEEKTRCAAAPEQYGGNCDSLWTPSESDYVAENYLPAIFNFRELFPTMLFVLAVLLALAAFAIGASFVGVEWRTGGMMNLLLWRPQRIRVLVTKLAALLGALTALTAFTTVLWTAAFWAIGKYRGETGRLTSGVWQSFGLTSLRGLVLVLVAATLGFGIASIGRHTAAAFGVAIGAVVVLQFGLGTVLNLAQVRFSDLYLAPYWIVAWLDKSVEITDWNAPCDFSATSGCEQPVFTITWQMSGAVLAALFVLVTATAMWTIRKRDIT
ncbi:ABC transporter permease subunit [Actinoplanes sp. CA-015351]|uniref:ABC transporter permease subunit n=1 Tax=Actinoplanes sp. CA-015351 TaxID=3239897 RepID=UPI003D962DC0